MLQFIACKSGKVELPKYLDALPILVFLKGVSADWNASVCGDDKVMSKSKLFDRPYS